MNEKDFIEPNNKQTEVEASQKLAKILVRERQSLKISKKEMAEKLFLQTDKLDSIEKGEFLVFENELYARLLIKKYLECLNLNADDYEELIKDAVPNNIFEETVNRNTFLKDDKFNYDGQKKQKKSTNNRRRITYSLLIFVLIIMAFFLVFNIFNTSKALTEEIAAQEAQNKSKQSQDLEINNEVKEWNLDNILVTSNLVLDRQENTYYYYNLNLNETQEFDIELTVENGSSYYDIQDASGTIMQYATLYEGESAKYTAKSPTTTLNIGNINDITIKINGEELVVENPPSNHIYIVITTLEE